MDLQQLLSQTLTPEAINAMAGQMGATPQQVEQGIGAALPALVGGLARNATRTPGGADTLANALERDHDGGLFDQFTGGGGAAGAGGAGLAGLLGGLLGGAGGGGNAAGGLMGALGGMLGGRATNGAGILGHIFGQGQGAVQDGVSRASGLGRGQSLQLLMMLAPLIMSTLGKLKRQRGLDAPGVATVLEDEEDRITQPVPGVNRGGLMDLLDRNNDGSFADDLAKIGAVVGGAYVLSRTSRNG